VEIPDSIAELLSQDPEKRTRSILQGLVIGAYTEGMISRGRAFELLGLDHWSGEAFFRERGIFLNYDAEAFRQDIGSRFSQPTDSYFPTSNGT
jgi:predicted HTH domain antitoxin